MLAREIAEGAAWRRANLPQRRPYNTTSDLTPEHHALLAHVEQLIRTTPYPDRATAPEDEPDIEQLLNVGANSADVTSEYTMARILLNADRAPAGDQPAKLRSEWWCPPVPPRLNGWGFRGCSVASRVAFYELPLPGMDPGSRGTRAAEVDTPWFRSCSF
ncbi:hypothetical protein [Streptomyces sp. KR80]|uniref:hypothetical protein n=1 Tax=Streptomyces sp. KR80 TaxID=3457426 RepID=UPI003FCF67A1